MFVKQAIVFGLEKALEYSEGIPQEISVSVGLGLFGILASLVAMCVLKEPE